MDFSIFWSNFLPTKQLQFFNLMSNEDLEDDAHEASLKIKNIN